MTPTVFQPRTRSNADTTFNEEVNPSSQSRPSSVNPRVRPVSSSLHFLTHFKKDILRPTMYSYHRWLSQKDREFVTHVIPIPILKRYLFDVYPKPCLYHLHKFLNISYLPTIQVTFSFQ